MAIFFLERDPAMSVAITPEDQRAVNERRP
jgi:hypothetical protein